MYHVPVGLTALRLSDTFRNLSIRGGGALWASAHALNIYQKNKSKKSQLGCLLSSLVHFNCKLVGVAFPFLTFLAPSLLLRLSLLEARITGRGGVPGTRCVSSLCYRSWLNTALTLSGSRCDVCYREAGPWRAVSSPSTVLVAGSNSWLKLHWCFNMLKFAYCMFDVNCGFYLQVENLKSFIYLPEEVCVLCGRCI